MMRKIVILLACLGLAFQQMSCTSNDSQADSEVAADVDSADLEKLESEGGEIADEESLGGDQLPEEALGETTEIAQADEAPADAPGFADTPADDVAAAPPANISDAPPTEESLGLPAEEMASVDDPLPPDPFAPSDTAAVAQSTPPPPPPEEPKTMAQVEKPKMVQPKVEEPADTYSSSSAMESSASTTYVNSEPSEPVVKKPSAPLQKIATEPWKVGKTWFNAVYFARPGDSLASISQMIYGADKTKEIKKGNPLFNSRDVRPGDKVYYNSPNRPSDSATLLTYYEDNGMAPEVYVAKPGDNIRKIAKNLLGYEGAWKEVWASNSVDSKGALPEGTELRFWKGGAVAAVGTPSPPAEPPMQPELAAAPAMPPPEIPAPPMNEPMPPPSQAQMDIPPPPPMQEPMADIPPPPPPDMPAAEQMPPPPPVQAMNPPPSEGEPIEEGMEGESGQDMTMALGVVGLAAAGLAVLIVMRKKRKQKELDMQAMENTHVGT